MSENIRHERENLSEFIQAVFSSCEAVANANPTSLDLTSKEAGQLWT